MSEPKTSIRRLEAVDKQQEALELRKAGKSFDFIAHQLGYASKAGAFRAVTSALQKTLQEPADDLRTIEVERLDALLEAQWEAAMRGVPFAVDRVLRIMERRAKLLGLDAPTKVDYRHIMIEEAQRLASEEGLDADEIMRDAERLMLGKV